LYIVLAKEEKDMKKGLQLLKIIQLFIMLPFSILYGSKKKAYHKIKRMMIAANLL